MIAVVVEDVRLYSDIVLQLELSPIIRQLQPTDYG